MITALIAIAASAVTAFATWRLCRAGQVLDAILRDALEPGPAEAGQALRTGLAEEIASAVEAAVPPPCDHRDRPSCPKCSARRTFLASARIVRETGGVT